MTTNTYLKQVNPHVRDQHIQFEENGHKYTILTDSNSKYTSVTTWNHSLFPHFDADLIIEKMMTGKGWKEGHKYWGLTPEQIKDLWNINRDNAAGAGTKLHYDIECFMNQRPPKTTAATHADLLKFFTDSRSLSLRSSPPPQEWLYFLQFVEHTPYMRPYRTEWMIYDEDLKLAGSIDMVYENEDGTLSIFDWKRAKEINPENAFHKYAMTSCIQHIPDSNYWHYALQLNTYKAILERKYDKVIKDLYLVRLHPESPQQTFELIEVPDLSKEIRDLFELRSSTIL